MTGQAPSMRPASTRGKEEKDPIGLAIRAGKMDDNTLVDVSVLAALLSLAPGSTRQAAYRSPEALPPRFPTPSRHLRWRLGDIREWIRRRAMLPQNQNGDATQTAPADREVVNRQTPDKKKKPGQSRKAEQVRLQKLGEKIIQDQFARTKGAE